MQYVIHTESLHFGFRKGPLIADGLNLEIPEGSVYGLLGENGAGKSTLIRLLLGLRKPQSGLVYLFGKPLNEARPLVFQRVGLVLEHPRAYPHLTVRSYLSVMATYCQLSAVRIDRALQDTQLAAVAGRKVRQLSTGQKQRLALAQAMMPEPDVYLLDEPTNGLDPAGIALVRSLLRRWHKQGKTILISSHQLSELEGFCTHFGLLHQGELVFQGSREKLTLRKQHNLSVSLSCSEPVKAADILREQFWEVRVLPNDHLEVQIKSTSDSSRINDVLRAAEIELYEMQIQRPRLEDIFLSLTKTN